MTVAFCFKGPVLSKCHICVAGEEKRKVHCQSVFNPWADFVFIAQQQSDLHRPSRTAWGVIPSIWPNLASVTLGKTHSLWSPNCFSGQEWGSTPGCPHVSSWPQVLKWDYCQKLLQQQAGQTTCVFNGENCTNLEKEMNSPRWGILLILHFKVS